MTSTLDYRFSMKRAEHESDRFIYEGLSYVERWAVHRAKGRAYRKMSDKVIMQTVRAMRPKSERSPEQLLQEVRAIKFKKKMRRINGKMMVCFIQVDKI